MNIAIFTDYYIPTTGGVQTSIFEQKKALESQGHTVYIVTASYPEHRDDPTIIGLNCIIKSKFDGHSHQAYVPWFGDSKKVAQQLAQKNIQLIHVQTEFTIASLGVAVAKKMDIPCVYTAHTLLWKQAEMGSVQTKIFGTVLAYVGIFLFACRPFRTLTRQKGESLASFAQKKLISYFANQADHFITGSRHFGKEIISWGVTTPHTAIPNWTQKATTQKPLPQKPTFLLLGRLEREKRPHVFFDACELLAQKYGDDAFSAIVVGGGEYVSHAKSLAHTRPWLTVTGSVDKDTAIDHINKSSLLVMTSLGFDNQPMVIAEAIMHRRGVIVCDPKLTEGTEHGAGVITPTPDAQGLATALETYIKTPRAINTLSDNAEKTQTLFLPATGAKNILAVYDSVLKQKNNP